MKVLTHSIEVTARLEFTAREVELLDNITSYDNKKWIDTICDPVHGNSYNGGVKTADLVAFLDNLRSAAATMKATINAAHSSLIR